MTVNCKLWLGSQESLELAEQAQAKIEEKMIGMGMIAQPETIYSYGYMWSRFDNVAVVDVNGPLVTRDSPFNNLFGVTSYNELRNAVAEAASQADIKAILLNLNTPGGNVAGLSEVSDFLHEVQTQLPVYSYVGSMAASAGYWLASSTQSIYATKMAEVGSIGVITTVYDTTEMNAKEGVKAEVIATGKFKAVGNPNQPLTDETRAYLVDRMNQALNEFISTISAGRGMPEAVVRNLANGKVWYAKEGVELGLVDSISSFDKVVQRLNSLSDNKSGMSRPGDVMAKKLTINKGGLSAIAAGVPPEQVATVEHLVEAQEVVEGVEETVEAEATTEVEAAEAAAPAAPAAAEVSGLEQLLAKTNDQIVDLRVQVKTLESELDSFRAVDKQMRDVLVHWMDSMTIALGGAAGMIPDTQSLSTLLASHQKILDTFTARFRPGAQVKTHLDQDNKKEAASPARPASSTTSLRGKK